jgi:hypothetical protein
MGSSGKKRTTMGKLNRESKLRDKRADKEARKTARKLTGSNGGFGMASGDEPDNAPLGTDAAGELAQMSHDGSRTPGEV